MTTIKTTVAYTYPEYPVEPPFQPKTDRILWYYNPDLGLGCWIMNNYNILMQVPKAIEDVIKSDESVYSYRSPVPLHDHYVPESFKGFMCWRVDETGMGKFCYLYRKEEGGEEKYTLSNI
jgi:hypothetical protein